MLLSRSSICIPSVRAALALALGCAFWGLAAGCQAMNAPFKYNYYIFFHNVGSEGIEIEPFAISGQALVDPGYISANGIRGIPANGIRGFLGRPSTRLTLQWRIDGEDKREDHVFLDVPINFDRGPENGVVFIFSSAAKDVKAMCYTNSEEARKLNIRTAGYPFP